MNRDWNNRPGGGSDRPGGNCGNNGGGRSGDFRRDGGRSGDSRRDGGRSGDFRRDGGDRPGGSSAPPSLPEDYLEALKKGYYCYDEESGKDVLLREYIYGYPARLVKYFGQGGTDKSSQVRKFYDYVLRIRERLDFGLSFAEVEADFCMLVGFANNAKERKTVSENFRRFIQANVDAVHSKEDLTAFAMHFQAVVAYLNK